MDSLLMYNYFLTLNFPFRSGRITMWSEEEKYIPHFKFKILDEIISETIYQQISETIENYKGDFKWTLIKNKNGSNYIIKPIIESKFLEESISPDQFFKIRNDTLELIKFLKINLNLKY